MRICYQDAQLCITSLAVSVQGRRYGLCDLQRAWRVGRPVVGRRVTLAGSLLLVVALAQVALGPIGWWVAAGSGVGLAAAAVLLAGWVGRLVAGATVLHAVEDIRRYGRRLELWASISGVHVLLLSTDDAIRYGQACRALARALNDRDGVRPPEAAIVRRCRALRRVRADVRP